MTEESERPEDDGMEWGYITPEGFRALPKVPLMMTGKRPPFPVTLPTGEVRHIITRPIEYGELS